MSLQTVIRRVVSVAAAVAILARAANAVDLPLVWDGDTDTVWNNGLNWVGDLAPTTADHAKITGTFANQPTLTGPESVGGVWITALGQDLASVLNDNLLSIGGNTINGIPNLAVLFDNTTGFNAAINQPISIDNDNLSVRNDTDQALTFLALTNNATAIQLNANTLTFSNNGAGSINTSVISGAGGVTIDSSGTGAVISGDNATSFSGQLTVARGILQLNTFNNNNTAGKLGQSSLSVILGSSGNTGTLRWLATATNTSTKKFTLATGGVGAIDLQPTTARTLTLSGVINGDGALQVQGNANGTLFLSGLNTYTGGTTVVSGTLALGGSSTGSITNGPVGTGTLTLSGGNLTAISSTRAIANDVVIAASTTSGIYGSGGNVTLNGKLTGSGTIDNTLDPGTNSTSIRFNGDLSGFTGTIIHNRVPGTADTYRFNGTTPESYDGSQAKFVLNGSTDTSLTTTIFRLATVSGSTFRMGELSGDGNYIRDDLTGSVGDNMTLEVGHLGTDSTWGGVFVSQPNVVGNFTKVGGGKLTLSGNSTYIGVTTVSAGTLRVNGNPTGGGAYLVNSGATLGGTGTINTSAQNASVTVDAGGKLAPGASAGVLHMDLGAGALDISGAVAASNSQSMLFELDAIGASDQVQLLNASVLSIGFGALEFNDFAFTNLGGLVAGTYTLFDSSAAITGTLGSSLSGMIGAFNATLGFGDSGNDIVLAVTSGAVLDGDYNLDGKVDAADYVLWRKSPGLHGGDPDGYNTWRQNFGSSQGSGSGLDGTAAVPEPTTLGVIAICMLLCVGRRSVSQR